MKHKNEIISSFHQILAKPNRKFIEQIEFVNLNEVNIIDADILTDILVTPWRWFQCQNGIISYSSKKYSPTKVMQKISIDTIENRFIKYFLDISLDIIDRILEKNILWGEFLSEILNFKEELWSIRKRSFFNEVGTMLYYPTNSQILIKQSGYNKIFKIERMLRNRYIPTAFSNLNIAFELKDMATLFEYYVFCKIIEALKSRGYKIYSKDWEKKIGFSKEKERYEYDYSRIELDNLGKKNIYYQKEVNVQFLLKNNKEKSEKRNNYPLRPDFLISYENNRMIVDAKFKFKENINTDYIVKDDKNNSDCRDNEENIVKYLKSYLIEETSQLKPGKLSNTVIVACLSSVDKIESKVFDYAHLFSDPYESEKDTSQKALLELFDKYLFSSGKSNLNLGYICMDLLNLK